MMSYPEENNIHPTNTDFHMELIAYATTSYRLLFIQDFDVFADFHTTNETFSDFSSFEHCSLFINEILPNVHSYPLTSSIKDSLKLLELNPFMRRNDQGYCYVPLESAAKFALKPECDFTMAEEYPKLLRIERGIPLSKKLLKLNAASSGKEGSHTMLVDKKAVTISCPSFQLSPDIWALLSAVVSTDLELSYSQLHNVQEVHRRLRRAKQSFEDKANIQPFCNNINKLTYNIRDFEKLSKTLCKILSKILSKIKDPVH